MLKTGTPIYISSMLSTDYRCMTRQALQGVIKPCPRRSVAMQELATKSFRFRAVHDYNILPVYNSRNHGSWRLENIPFD